MMAFTCEETTKLFTSVISLASSKNSTDRFFFTDNPYFLARPSNKARAHYRLAAWSYTDQRTGLAWV